MYPKTGTELSRTHCAQAGQPRGVEHVLGLGLGKQPAMRACPNRFRQLGRLHHLACATQQQAKKPAATNPLAAERGRGGRRASMGS